MSETPASAPTRKSLPPDRKLSFWPFLIVLDLFLRWATLGFVTIGAVSTFWMWVLQIVGIPAIVFVIAISREARLRKRHGLEADVELTPDFTGFAASVVFFAVAVGATQVYVYTDTIPWRWLRVVTTAAAAIVYAFYLLTLYAASPQLRVVGPGAPIDETECDANDRVIIQLDVQRGSLQQRVDTYTLESALFGALSFSSFVTIAASEKVKLEHARAFVTEVGRLFKASVALNGDSAMLIAQNIAQETPLLAAIAAETLVCSALFLSVIICRLRFNDLLARADYYIRLGMQFNAKEDDLQNVALQLEKVPDDLNRRLKQLHANIAEAVAVGRQAMRGLRPVVTYMSLFRGLGVTVFLTILITSSMWISSGLAIVFAGLTMTAYFYPLFDRWVRDRSLRQALNLESAGRLFGLGGTQPKG
jgi:hypothetical protein